MSNNQTIQIGAYIEVIMKPHTTYTDRSKCPKCEVNRNTNFCHVCGSEIKRYQHKEEKYLSYYDINEDDDLIQQCYNEDHPEIMILSSNFDDETHYSLDDQDEGVYAIPESSECVNAMDQIFARHIIELRNHNLVEKVSLKYGALVYWW